MVERALIAPPTARLGPVTAAERKADRQEPDQGQIRPDDRSGIGLRNPASPCRQHAGVIRRADPQRPGPWGQAPREDVPSSPPQSQPRRSGSSVPRMPRSPLPPDIPEQAPSGGGWGDVIGDVLGGGSAPGPRGGRSRGRMSTGEVVGQAGRPLGRLSGWHRARPRHRARRARQSRRQQEVRPPQPISASIGSGVRISVGPPFTVPRRCSESGRKLVIRSCS